MSLRLHEVLRPTQLFDSGDWHEALVNGVLEGSKKPDRVTLFLPSGNGLRHQSLQAAVDRLGLKINHVKRIAGPPVEEGATPLDRAQHKILHGLQDSLRQGYFDRHPADLLLLVAADSRNLYGGKYRDKANGDFPLWHGQYQSDWLNVASGKKAIDETGYAGAAVLGNRMVYADLVDRITVTPKSRSVVLREFEPARFELAMGNAHGLNSRKLIQSGDLHVARITGDVLFGRDALERVYGGSQRHFEQLLTSLMLQVNIR